MHIRPFIMEEWYKKYRPFVTYNLADSGVRDLTVGEIFELCNEDTEILNQIKLEYKDSRGSEELREAISQTYISVKPENILVTTTTSEALFIVFNEILNAGDTVIIEFPAFQSLYEIPRALGCNVKFLELKPEEGYLPNISQFKKLIDTKTKLIVINNPHNPTGSTLSSEELLKIWEIAESRGAYLLADEHYRFLPLDGTGIVPSMVDLDDKVIGAGSITKCFGMIGLRMGWLIGPQELLQRCRHYKDYLTHVLSPISDFISTMVIKNREVVLKKNIQMMRKNVNVFESFISHYNDILSWVPPKGGAVCFPKYNLDISSDQFCKGLIDQENVFLLPGSCFEKEGFFRMCLGVENRLFAEAIERMDRYLRSQK